MGTTRESNDYKERTTQNPILLNQRISPFKDYANCQKYGTYYEDRETIRDSMKSDLKMHRGSRSPKVVTGSNSLKSKSVMQSGRESKLDQMINTIDP